MCGHGWRASGPEHDGLLEPGALPAGCSDPVQRWPTSARRTRISCPASRSRSSLGKSSHGTGHWEKVTGSKGSNLLSGQPSWALSCLSGASLSSAVCGPVVPPADAASGPSGQDLLDAVHLSAMYMYGHLQAGFDAGAGAWTRYNHFPLGRIRHAVTWHNLAAYLPPASATEPMPRVLDASGGSGELAVELVQHGYQVWLLDYASAMLDRARDAAAGLPDSVRTRLTFCLDSVAEVSGAFAPGFFDAVCCQRLVCPRRYAGCLLPSRSPWSPPSLAGRLPSRPARSGLPHSAARSRHRRPGSGFLRSPGAKGGQPIMLEHGDGVRVTAEPRQDGAAITSGRPRHCAVGSPGQSRTTQSREAQPFGTVFSCPSHLFLSTEKGAI